MLSTRQCATGVGIRAYLKTVENPNGRRNFPTAKLLENTAGVRKERGCRLPRGWQPRRHPLRRGTVRIPSLERCLFLPSNGTAHAPTSRASGSQPWRYTSLCYTTVSARRSLGKFFGREKRAVTEGQLGKTKKYWPRSSRSRSRGKRD